jgi:hypothetical protein
MASPFVSTAQRQKWQELVRTGKKSQADFDARETATGGANLPARAGKPKKPSTSQYDRALKASKY